MTGTRFRRLRYVVGLMWQADATMTSIVIGAMVLVSISGGALALALRWMLDGVVRDDAGLVLTAVAVGAIAKGIENGLSRVQGNQQMVLVSKVSALLDREILMLSASLPGLEHLERPEYLDKVKLVQGRGNDLARVVPASIESVSLLFRVSVTGALLASVHPLLLLLPALAGPSLWLTKRSHKVITDAQAERAESSRLETHLHNLFNEPTSGRELAVFGATDALDDRCRQLYDELARHRLKAHITSTLVALGGWVAFALGFTGALGFVVWRTVNGQATPGEILLVTQLANEVRGQVGGVAETLRGLFTALRTLDRHQWLLDYASRQVRSHGEPAVVPSRLDDGIRIESLSFRYPGSDADVLRDVSLEVPAGSTLAVVGENGAGKSTLVKLLCRFYVPTSGTISLDGVDISRFDVDEWRSQVSATFQDFARIEALARESVGIGDLVKVDDVAEVTKALARAEAERLPDSWPLRLETLLGKTYHDGVQPSGGQWQKLAIARTFMRATPLLLILDEPTASLDAASEDALFRRYSDAAREARERGAITLLISHRFSTVRMADYIVVLDQGTIVESGSHAELMTNNGLYAEMFTLQAAAYR